MDVFKEYKWTKWLERPFNPFILSVLSQGIREEYFAKIGAPNIECEATLYQFGFWYESQEVWDKMTKLIDENKPNLLDIGKNLKNFYKINKPKIATATLEEFYEMLNIITAYVFLTHGFENYYKDIHQNVYPKKKNAHAKMEDEMRNGATPEFISEKYGWIRARDGFCDPFSVKDIKQMISELKPLKQMEISDDPKLEQLQELIFMRTERTDILYEFLFLARPLLTKIGKQFGLEFQDLKNYTIQSLIEGKPRRIESPFTAANFNGEITFYNRKIVEDEEYTEDCVKGFIANKGYAKGPAKIVKFVSELDKVKEGDILVCQMTFPSFVSAMNRAAAFVTDEGGLTCHAAIVAREMGKPCIIATKHATTIFKDGDIVELKDGVVRKV